MHVDLEEVHSSFAQLNWESEEVQPSPARFHQGAAGNRPFWRDSSGVFDGWVRL